MSETTMREVPDTPIIGEAAFDSAQVEGLRKVLEECRPLMRDAGRYANSVSFRELEAIGRRDLLTRAFDIFLASKAHDLAASKFPNGYCLPLSVCAFRIHQPDVLNSHLGLHLDANFLGAEDLTYNVWVTLDDLGEGVPGLLFLRPELPTSSVRKAWRSKFNQIIAQRGPTTGINYMFQENALAAHFRKPIDEVLYAPRVKAGSFIAFHQLVMHATEVVADHEKLRRSIEFRVTSANAIPRGCRPKGGVVAVCRATSDGGRFMDYVDMESLL